MNSLLGTNCRQVLSEQSYAWKCNRWRCEEYRVERRVELRGQKKVFVRRATNELSAKFLSDVYYRERFAAQAFQGKAEVVGGEWENDKLVYRYLHEPTLEEKISAAIEANEEGFGSALVKEYVAFVRSLPTTLCVPSAFYDFINYSATSSLLECLTFGPYDCIPRNVIIGRDRWKILDLEWTFEFPLPQKFVLWRGLLSLLRALQGHIQAHVSQQSPVFLLQGHGRSRIYLPCAWYEAFEVKTMDLETYGLWDQLFYRKVLISEPTKPNRVRLNGEPRAYRTLPTQANLLVWVEEVVRRIFAWGKAIRRVRHLRRISNQAL
jgi:hypothetical protein